MIEERLALYANGEQILSALDDHIAVLDREGNIIHVNESWKRFGQNNGAPPGFTGVGSNYLEVCRRSVQVRKEILAGIQAVLGGSSPHFRYEYRCDSPSEPRWFELKVNPLPEPDGGAVISHTDISALSRVRDEYSAVLEGAEAILWRAKPPDFQPTFVSKHVERILGYRVNNCLKKRGFWREHIDPEDRDRVLALLRRATQEQQRQEFEYRMIAANGQTVWIHTIVNVVVRKGVPVEIVAVSVDIRERKRAEDALASLSGRLIEAQEEERRRVARELHDDYNQRLAVLGFDLQRLADEIGDTSLEAGQQLHTLFDRVNELSSDLHSLSHRLHSSTLETLGLVAGVNAFCREFAQQQHIQIDFAHENIPRDIPGHAALCMFRIVQETLRNVKKHSGGDRAEVRLEWSGEKLRLSVSDRGKGFEPNKPSAERGIGIRSMEERLRILGGQLEVHSKTMEGTRIAASLPLRVATWAAS